MNPWRRRSVSSSPRERTDNAGTTAFDRTEAGVNAVRDPRSRPDTPIPDLPAPNHPDRVRPSADASEMIRAVAGGDIAPAKEQGAADAPSGQASEIKVVSPIT